MKGNLDLSQEKHWPHFFLPGGDGTPELLLMYIANTWHQNFAINLPRDHQELRIILAEIRSQEHHNWLDNLCEKLAIEKPLLIYILIKVWSETEEGQEQLVGFIKRLKNTREIMKVVKFICPVARSATIVLPSRAVADNVFMRCYDRVPFGFLAERSSSSRVCDPDKLSDRRSQRQHGEKSSVRFSDDGLLSPLRSHTTRAPRHRSPGHYIIVRNNTTRSIRENAYV